MHTAIRRQESCIYQSNHEFIEFEINDSVYCSRRKLIKVATHDSLKDFIPGSMYQNPNPGLGFLYIYYPGSL